MKKTKKTKPFEEFSVRVNFHKVGKIVSADWIRRVCNTIFIMEKKFPQGEVSIVFVSDDYISQLNKKFLSKDMPTDVLAFPMNEEDIWGEVYISLDRAIEQSEHYKINVQVEIARLVIHGILHMLGYDDQSTESKNDMRKRENFYLEQLNINL